MNSPDEIQEATPTVVNAPPYPSVQGQVMPDLNLAGISTPKTDLSGGNFADSTPPQNISVPPLKSSDPNTDVNQMGIDTNVNYFELNLANAKTNIPSPAMLAQQWDGTTTINTPTYTGSDYSVPLARAFNLTDPGIDCLPPMTPDPTLPDLLNYGTPRGMDITAASSDPMAIDPMVPDLSLYDRPAGLSMPGPLMVDPLHPDLQYPSTTQDVMMPDRPADLSVGALNIMHDTPTYNQIPADTYEQLWMAQAGNNQTRERHQGMLMYGLDREES